MNAFLEEYPLNYLDELVSIPTLIGQVLRCKPPAVLLANINTIVCVLEQLLLPSGVFEVSQMIYDPPNHDFKKLRLIEWITEYIVKKYSYWRDHRGFLHECTELNPNLMVPELIKQPKFTITQYDKYIRDAPVIAHSLEWFEKTHNIGILHWKIQKDINSLNVHISTDSITNTTLYWIFPFHHSVNSSKLFNVVNVFTMELGGDLNHTTTNIKQETLTTDIILDNTIFSPSITSIFTILKYPDTNIDYKQFSTYCIFRNRSVVDKTPISVSSILDTSVNESKRNYILLDVFLRKTSIFVTVYKNCVDSYAVSKLWYYIITTWVVINGLEILNLHDFYKPFVIKAKEEVENVNYDHSSSLFNYTKEKILLTTKKRLVCNIEGYLSRFETTQNDTTLKKDNSSASRRAKINIGKYTSVPCDTVEDTNIKEENLVYTSVEYFINRRLMIIWKQHNRFLLHTFKGQRQLPCGEIFWAEGRQEVNPLPTQETNSNIHEDNVIIDDTPVVKTGTLQQTFEETDHTISSGYYISHFFRHDAGVSLEQVDQFCPKKNSPPMEQMFRFWFKPAPKSTVTENKIELKWSLITNAIDLPIFIRQEISIVESIVDIKNNIASSILYKLKVAQEIQDVDEIIRIRLGIVVLLLDPEPTDQVNSMGDYIRTEHGKSLTDSMKLLVPFVFGKAPTERKKKYRSHDTFSNTSSLLYSCDEWTEEEKHDKLLGILKNGLLVPTFKQIYFNFTFKASETPLVNFYCPSVEREPLLLSSPE